MKYGFEMWLGYIDHSCHDSYKLFLYIEQEQKVHTFHYPIVYTRENFIIFPQLIFFQQLFLLFATTNK